MKNKVVLGVDPGNEGCLAFLGEDSLRLLDMPLIPFMVGKRKRNTVDPYTLAREIDAVSKDISHCYIEKVHSLPRDGSVGAFSFGKGYGTIIGVLAANFIPITFVQPSVWKKALGAPADKAGARLRASELLPQYAHNWPLVKHDGRAEASLIALWGSKQNG